MKKTTLLLTGFIMSCFLSAQGLNNKSGQVIIEAKIVEVGRYTISLPDDIRPGDMISGSIKSFPDGKKDKEIEKNKESLSSNNIRIGDHVFPVSSPLVNFTLSQKELDNLLISITNKEGKILSSPTLTSSFNGQSVISSNFSIPTHCLVGSPLRITGPFDGNSDNTKCTIGGKPAEIIAESPRQCIVEFPADVKGPTTITIEENGVSIKENIGGVDMNITAGRMNLKRGESTYIDIAITGLENLSDDAVLSVANITTTVVTMIGGNVQVITIPPSGISGAGTYNQRFNIQSLLTGNFSINIDLKLPDPPNSSAPVGINKWVACEPCGGIMMPQSTCTELTKLINQYPGNQLTQAPDTTCNCFTFKPVINGDNIQLQVEPAVNKDLAMLVYTNTTPGKQEKVIGNDNLDNKKVTATNTILTTGINTVTATAYHGNNYTTSQSHNVVIIPNFNNSITNSLINEYRKRIQQIKDSIDNLQRIIDNDNRKIYENYPEKRRLDSIERVKQGYYNQLVQIDAVLESIPKVYADTLSKLLDSLRHFKNKVPDIPDEDALKKKVEDLEAALKACQDHLAALQQEQKDLQKEQEQVEQQQSDQLQKILDCFAAAGYDYVGHTTRKDGEFGYGFDAVKNGQALNGIPAQCLKTVSEAKKKIEELKQRHREIRNRLKDIPGEITQSKVDCERLSKELQQAKESLRKGKNAIIEYGFINADLDDICRQIRGMLDGLINFCKLNPGVCNAESQVETLMANCPQANFWDGFNKVVDYKKGIEGNVKKQADDAKRQTDQTREYEKRIYEEIYRAKQQQDQKAAELPGLIQKEEDATEAELEKKMVKEDSARAMRRKECEEFLKTQAKTKEEKGLIETLISIKKGVQGFGENVKKASEYGDKLTKERYKEITDSLRSLIDRMLAPLKDYDKLKKKYDKWMKIKEDIQTVFSSDNSPKANAEKLKIILERIKEQLDGLTEEFPILELFVNYFGYLVDSYSWAVDQSFKNAETFFRNNLEAKLKSQVNCQWLMNEYLKRKNTDDVIRRAKERINWEGEIEPLLGGAGARDAAEGEMKKLILQMLADCCISYLMQ